MNDQQFQQLIQRLDNATGTFGNVLWPEIVQRHITSGCFDLFVGLFFGFLGFRLFRWGFQQAKENKYDSVAIQVLTLMVVALAMIPTFVNLHSAVVTLSAPKASALMELLRR